MEERAATATWSQQQKSSLLRGTAGESYFVLGLQICIFSIRAEIMQQQLSTICILAAIG